MLGSRIASLRCKAGMSQSALAKKLGVSPSTIGMYEQGRREPSINILIALSREFGVTVDYLLTGNDRDVPDNMPLSQTMLVNGKHRKFCASKAPTAPFTREELAVLLAAQLMTVK